MTTHFGRRAQAIRAVDGIDLELARGETFGLVGESGSGKTTLGRTILRLTQITSGRVVFDGQDVSALGREELRRLRQRIQMIFQDPYSSLSPRKRISTLLTEPYTINRVPEQARYSVADLLDMVELSPGQASKYPHELSGGQARRVGIARALALKPEFIVADEPTAGLDVSAAAAVLNLMSDLGRELGLTYLLITHNLNVVGYIADRIAVMYLGRLVELGSAEQVIDAPAHPYTSGLLEAVSEPGPRRRAERPLLAAGDISSPKNPPSGCRYHTRCPLAFAECDVIDPGLREIGRAHWAACRLEVDAPAGPRRARQGAGSPT